MAIDYGDGDHYTNDSQHLDAIFAHTYQAAGSFTVTAVVTDAAGQTASATCLYTWAPPAPPPPPVTTGSGDGGASSDSSTGSSSGGTVNPPGAVPTALCRDGTYSYSQHHSGTCSHHGGVAKWLDG